MRIAAGRSEAGWQSRITYRHYDSPWPFRLSSSRVLDWTHLSHMSAWRKKKKNKSFALQWSLTSLVSQHQSAFRGSEVTMVVLFDLSDEILSYVLEELVEKLTAGFIKSRGKTRRRSYLWRARIVDWTCWLLGSWCEALMSRSCPMIRRRDGKVSLFNTRFQKIILYWPVSSIFAPKSCTPRFRRWHLAIDR